MGRPPVFTARESPVSRPRPSSPAACAEVLEARALLTAAPFVGAPAADGGPVAELRDTFRLNSREDARHTIYLDFDGHATTDPFWTVDNGDRDFATPEYSRDGRDGFSAADLKAIQEIWRRVTEDFLPFDVNVTTEDPGAEALRRRGSGDRAWGVRAVVGGDGAWFDRSGGTTGVAGLDTFDSTRDREAFIFPDLVVGDPQVVAEIISHEVGHTLGLDHDGDAFTDYHAGRGRGATGWAPIMGAGEARELSQWSRGSYSGADNRQDDLRIITTRNGFGYAADDHAGAARGATAVKARGTRVGELATGVIGASDDADAFTFRTAGGRATLRVEVSELGANLDAKLELFDARGRLVGESDPAGELGAELKLNLAAGTYTAVVSGVGNANSSGDDYGSLGWFSLSGLFRNVGSAQAGPGVAVTAQRTLTTSEGGKTAKFRVRLTERPDYRVTLLIESADRSEGRPRVHRVVFLPDDWRRRRTVVVEGRDDRGADGDVRYRIKLKPLLSRDADYAGVNAEDLRAVNNDDDAGDRRRSFNTAAAGRAEARRTRRPKKRPAPFSTAAVASPAARPPPGTTTIMPTGRNRGSSPPPTDSSQRTSRPSAGSEPGAAPASELIPNPTRQRGTAGAAYGPSLTRRVVISGTGTVNPPRRAAGGFCTSVVPLGDECSEGALYLPRLPVRRGEEAAGGGEDAERRRRRPERQRPDRQIKGSRARRDGRAEPPDPPHAERGPREPRHERGQSEAHAEQQQPPQPVREPRPRRQRPRFAPPAGADPPQNVPQTPRGARRRDGRAGGQEGVSDNRSPRSAGEGLAARPLPQEVEPRRPGDPQGQPADRRPGQQRGDRPGVRQAGGGRAFACTHVTAIITRRVSEGPYVAPVGRRRGGSPGSDCERRRRNTSVSQPSPYGHRRQPWGGRPGKRQHQLEPESPPAKDQPLGFRGPYVIRPVKYRENSKPRPRRTEQDHQHHGRDPPQPGAGGVVAEVSGAPGRSGHRFDFLVRHSDTGG